MDFVQKIHITTASLIASLALVSCSAEDGLTSNETPTCRSELQVNASIASSEGWTEDLSSRAVVTGTTPANNFTFGFFACDHEETPATFVPFSGNEDYRNLRAIRSSNKWLWSFESSTSATFNPLYFITDNTDKHLDFYAYAPYKSGVRLNHGYDFKIDDQTDVMWASYGQGGAVDGTPTNRDCTIVPKGTIPLNIQFHHALARIVFHFKQVYNENNGSDATHDPDFDDHKNYISSIVLQKSDQSQTYLYMDGNVNLLTGEVSPLNPPTYGTSQTISYAGTTFNTNYNNTADLLLYPIEYQQDGDFSVKFTFNTNTVLSYSLKKSDITHANGTVGFQSGYVYHLYFVFENYIRLDHVVINDTWTMGEETEVNI